MRLTRVLFAIGVLAILLVVAARLASRRFLFPAHEVRAVAVPADVPTWTITARDGVTVHALALVDPRDARVFVHFHNNRETAADSLWIARELRRRGTSVVLAEFRGYGTSRSDDASPSEEGLYLDAEAVLDRVARAGFGPERVVLWGTSLGTGVAAEMARRGRGSALVLVTPYTSIPDVVAGRLPVVPPSLLVRDDFDTIGKARDIATPTLVVHGDADEIVPFAMGERLARTLPHATLLRVGGARHGDVFVRGGASLFDAVARFGG